MKKTIILALLAIATAANAQDNDTLVIHNPRKVTIVTNDSLQKITVVGREGDDKFTYQSTIQIVDSNYVSTTRIGRDLWDIIPSVKIGKTNDGQPARNAISSHLGIGFTAPTKADGRTDFSTFRSWEIFATIAQYDHYFDRRCHNQLSMGFGIDWKNYRMTGDTFFTKDAEGNVTVDKYPSDVEPKFSRIKVFSLTANLGFVHTFNDDFWIGFGPVVNFNTYASIKTKYKVLGETSKRVEKHINQRPVTLDWMLNVGFMGVPLYLKYSNNDVLKDGGIKFRSLSFGLYL